MHFKINLHPECSRYTTTKNNRIFIGRMNYMLKIYKILTLSAFILTGCLVTAVSDAREITFIIKSLGSGTPVSNAVVDLQSCHLGKFLSDENGRVQLNVDQISSCVLYISSSGYITLVRSFQIPSGGDNLEMVFYMQKQEQYKMGRILSAESQIPITQVKVFRQKEDGTEELIAISDQSGKFGLVNYHSGEYHLIFRHPDYYPQEKSIFIRRTDGQLGSFYMDGEKQPSKVVTEKSPKLIGITSKKFSFLGSDKKYIIVLGLYKGREHLPTHRDDLDLQFVEKGGWIRMFVGPYDNEKTAIARLEDIRKKYPQAMLKTE